MCLFECNRVEKRTKFRKLEPPGTLIWPQCLSPMVLKQKCVRIVRKNLSLQATDRFSAQRIVTIRQGRIRRKPTEKRKKAIIIIVSVYVLCVAVPTGLHTVSILAVWNAETEEMQLEIYYSEGRYRVLRFRKCFEESNI